VITTRKLEKRYGATPALADLTLDVPDGSVFALLGPNGAGKTTAIRILLNIIQASGGTAEVLGTDTRKLGPRELASIGYVSENRELPAGCGSIGSSTIAAVSIPAGATPMPPTWCGPSHFPASERCGPFPAVCG
jgi:ABC-type Mn2+/Zn2+ transport system ATPase subunit